MKRSFIGPNQHFFKRFSKCIHKVFAKLYLMRAIKKLAKVTVLDFEVLMGLNGTSVSMRGPLAISAFLKLFYEQISTCNQKIRYL